jgi:nitrite reductase/ring-hydroxylating ferredoxin subunit
VVRTRALARAAIYQRSIAASIARIWENVLDWQHLPWLHRTSFAAVRVLEQSADGWRAWVTTAAPRRRESLIDVRLDRPALGYVTRTLEGDGAGTEITTLLTASAERATRIHVRFDVPQRDAARLETIGAGFRRLYARLWDEDEAMMTRRQAVLDAAAGFAPAVARSMALGRVDELRRRLPLRVHHEGRDLRLVEIDGELFAHPTICPHLGGPLDDAPLEAGCVTCPWHGYRYDVRSGRCVSGKPLALEPLPRVVVDRDRGEASLTW